MPYTTEDYAGLEKLGENARKGMAAGKNSALDNSKYSISPEGQSEYMKELIEMIGRHPQCLGFYYWEPAWIPVVGSGWATSASGASQNWDMGSDPCPNLLNSVLFQRILSVPRLSEEAWC